MMLNPSEKEMIYEDAMKSMTLASAPEELVEGMASFLREVGVNNSYIDNDDLKARGEKEPLWLFL